VRFARRTLLTTLPVLAAACIRQPPRPSVPTATPTGDFDPLYREAQGALTDALETLRTFDTFQAFRVSTAAQTTMRLPSELVWDAPRAAEWDEAKHVARGLRGRADQLFMATTNLRVDTSQWRERRALADATADVIRVADALAAYSARIDTLPPGDASGALSLLDTAWAQWEVAAGRWGLTRAEAVSCAG
jgi:hypothetical protein